MISLRTILPGDNLLLSSIIKTTLIEFGATQPGSAFDDVSTDCMFELFQTPGSFYYVAEKEGKIVGGCGIYPTAGLPVGTCELVKMYLLPEVRGFKLGSTLITRCLDTAKNKGYNKVYLETKLQLKSAVAFYGKHGFNFLKNRLGDSGHYGCEIWMIKSLSN